MSEKESQNISSKMNYKILMQNRIRRVLMICTSYDAYILEEDGRIEDQIYKEYVDLNLSNPPTFTWVNSSMDALKLLDSDDDFDLIISMINVGELDVFKFSKLCKVEHPYIPFVLLSNFSRELERIVREEDCSAIDHIFSWHGNADLILAIIKLFEDRINADDDILNAGVQSILLVEDSIRFYSTYLPTIYRLVLEQSAEFLKETLNEQQQKLRKRARPKILLATCYEEAVSLYQKYKQNLLGVISDVAFVIHKNDPPESEKIDAGIDLCKMIKNDDFYMPFLLQSSQESMRNVAESMGVGFILKHSKTLLLELSEYISEEFVFGDFVFRDNNSGIVYGKAKDLKDLQHLIMEIPEDVLLYHASRNRLSKWMYSRGLFDLANKIRDVREGQFNSINELRNFIVKSIIEYRMVVGHGVVAKFNKETYEEFIWFARLGEGSLGGKARGLAFINSMLQKHNLLNKYPGVKILIPRTIVIATDYFDEFIKENGLQYVINSEISDEELLSEFTSSRLPARLIEDLSEYIKYVNGPLAVRSSSKLEDSHYQPFAGIYSTYMIPFTQNSDQMLRLLGKAIKSVYASVYYASSRSYIQATSNLISEEKMAVVIQDVCGTEDSGYFFPTLSGVARSVNFYPIGDEKPEDGIVNMAFGLGRLVVEGEKCLRFSPKHPKHILQLSTPELALKETQNHMYALNLKPEEFKTSIDESVNLAKFDINQIKHFRNMQHVASTWNAQDEMLIDSNLVEGRKVITFAHILKHDVFPLADIICDILNISQTEMRTPVEIEFAVNMDVDAGQDIIFNLLQIRPVADNQDYISINWDKIDKNDCIIYAEKALGVGNIEGITDIIYIREENFDNSRTKDIAAEINYLNKNLKEEGNNYILIGPGRWGSSDSWLGIPVKWSDISEAKVIVECGQKNFHVEPSQGTHFFQNLTSLGIGYLTINPFLDDGKFDREYLDSLEAVHESNYLRHIRFKVPLKVCIDGKNSRGIVIRPITK
ncbi:MAG TPA: PEP/pyruvate-binding domain-containing protein [Bacteroidales bacterium]|nr:PEP/pyruvate-binding domain-containing protein [Bacteroidales bacterium]HRR48366.1 PEP/pyruvate-binding domain-containing protein [Bacteroidales bacterium]HRT33076.1 PEP/pyruvate-binding domain-containing protein [Bacteroidales bacterium]HRT83205.1 PEP/pyruvate-binding domain-containing protein [Bacteroidales bacterium]